MGLRYSREFSVNPATKRPIERRSFGADLEAAVKIAPFGKLTTVKWGFDKGIECLIMGDGEHLETRIFPTTETREQMNNIAPRTIPGGYSIKAWWDESSEEAEKNHRPMTLNIGVIPDANAPKTQQGDGLDGMIKPRLLALAGRLGIKDSQGKPLDARMKEIDIVAEIRNHRAKHPEPKQETANATVPA